MFYSSGASGCSCQERLSYSSGETHGGELSRQSFSDTLFEHRYPQHSKRYSSLMSHTKPPVVCHLQVSYKDCEEIVAACRDAGVILTVCHVLRYSAQAIKIKELIDSGVIGDVVNIQLTGPVRTGSLDVI